MDEKYHGGHNTKKLGNVFREHLTMPPSEYVDRNCFLAASTPGGRRHRPPPRIGVRQHPLGQRLPAPRGHVPLHPRAGAPARSATSRWTRSGRMLGTQRRRGLRHRRRRAGQPLVDRIGPTVAEIHGDVPLQAIPAEVPRVVSGAERMEGLLGELTIRAPGGRGEMPVGFPMPRDPALLTDPGRRVHVTRRPGRRFPFPVPNGWFAVAESADVAPGGVRALYYFGRDLVVFRGEDGDRPRGRRPLPPPRRPPGGGRPGRGGVPALPVPRLVVRGRRGPLRRDPLRRGRPASRPRPAPGPTRWSSATGWSGPGTTPPRERRSTTCRWWPSSTTRTGWRRCCTSSRSRWPAEDMAENNVDYAHFRFVHGSDAIPETEFLVDGTYKRTVSNDGAFVREGFGLGLGVLRIEGFTTFLSSTTPIDEEHVHVRWLFTAPRGQRRDGRGRGRRDAQRRGQPGHRHLGEQGLPRPARC